MKLAFETKVKVVFEIIKAKLGFSSLYLRQHWRVERITGDTGL